MSGGTTTRDAWFDHLRRRRRSRRRPGRAAAEAEQASLIVLGSHGPRSSLLGSTSTEVSRRAPCPVVVVPPPANAAANGTNDSQLAGGIARFELGGGGTDFAGGIARFTFGSREAGG